jgi:hypothetical protein
VWLFVTFSGFPFPLNVLTGLLMPGVIFVFFLRIQLERALVFWRSLSSSKEWRVSEVTEELIEIFRKQQEKKTTNVD